MLEHMARSKAITRVPRMMPGKGGVCCMCQGNTALPWFNVFHIENAAAVLLKLEELRACCVCVPQAERKHSLTSNG